ncbi:MAG: chemotaxis protein CheW [Acidobacteriota bacterium]
MATVAEKAQGKVQADLAGKYVTFFLGKEEYGLPILNVREIIGLVPITPVPQTPKYIRGVINLRGQVIPVMDLRLKFGLPATEETRETCIIVVRVHGMDTGVIVDRMSEVADVEADNIQDPPAMGTEVDTSFILGIDKSEQRVRLLLDLEKVLSSSDLAAVQESVED